jgi:hypothetical protein
MLHRLQGSCGPLPAVSAFSTGFSKPMLAELRPKAAATHYDNDDLLTRFVHRTGKNAESTPEIGGMYCSACVWLLENAMKAQDSIPPRRQSGDTTSRSSMGCVAAAFQ